MKQKSLSLFAASSGAVRQEAYRNHGFRFALPVAIHLGPCRGRKSFMQVIVKFAARYT